MRKATLTTSILLLAALSANVFAVGNIGPATAELKAKQWSLGGDYAYSDVDLDTGK
jgi:hypothetical protein